jgi:hypothetical protein
MFDWLRGLFGKTAQASEPQGESPPPGSPATARDQWTIPGVYFDTAGWRLTDATQTSMSWVGDFGGGMTLTKDGAAARTSQPVDLDAARREHRARAAQNHGGLVSVEVVEMAGGAAALEVITKYPHGLGFGFEGRLFIDEGPERHTLRIAGDEARTGVRESIVNGLRIQLGEVDLLAMMSGPVDGATGGRPIPGMKMDPYDSAYDDQATYSASDDPRIDVVLQKHPLAVIRATLQRARSTWECSSSVAQADAPRHARPPSTGPKVILSDNVVRELYRLAKE